MNTDGHIYEMDDAQCEALLRPIPENALEVKLREDVARLDGYLKARAEADRPKMATSIKTSLGVAEPRLDSKDWPSVFAVPESRLTWLRDGGCATAYSPVSGFDSRPEGQHGTSWRSIDQQLAEGLMAREVSALLFGEAG